MEPSGDDLHRQLRALIFGPAEAPRWGAPEPELIGDLAPLLPPEALLPAARLLAGIGVIQETERRRGLLRLIRRADWLHIDEVLREVVARYPTIVFRLPPHVQPRVLRRLEPEVWDVVIDVAGPGDSVALGVDNSRRVIDRVTSAFALPEYEYYRRRTAAAFLAHPIVALDASVARELLLHARRDVSEPEQRARAILGLLPDLPEDERLAPARDAWEAATATHWPPARIELLARLRRVLPEPDAGRALGQALDALAELPAETMPDRRAQALAAIAAAADPQVQAELTFQIHALDLSYGAPIELAPLLSETQLRSQIRTLPRGWGAPDVVAALVPHLPGALWPELLTELMSWEPALAARALSAIAEQAGPERLPDIQSAAERLEDPWWSERVRWTVAKTALAWQESAGPPADDAGRLARGDWGSGAYLLTPAARLFAQLPPEEQTALANEMVESIWARYGGAGPPTTAAPPGAPEDTPLPSRQHRARADGHSHTVNTGFADVDDGTPRDRLAPLESATDYLFWLEVGAPVSGAIDVEPTPLPIEQLPPHARLTVALFAFEAELELTPGCDSGELVIEPDGVVRVARAVAEPRVTGDRQDRRLFFPVRTPARSGRFRLRCSLYCEQVLVQSHVVTADVATGAGRLRRRALEMVRTRALRRAPTAALEARVDYNLSHSLRTDRLARIGAHRLSIMLNDNPDGTHGFRFYGVDGARVFKSDASLPPHDLQDLIEQSRRALREAAWGDTAPWQGQAYRYDAPPDVERLRRDLARFAKWGYRFYDALIGRLAGGSRTDRSAARQAQMELQALMRTTGIVQLAARDAVRHVVPLALLYDHAIDSTAPLGDYALCPAFGAALPTRTPLAELACFDGECPSADAELTVCPSGFWGFRHSLGLPVSLGEGDAAVDIAYETAPRLSVAVSTDPAFVHRAAHETALQALRPDLGWTYATTREDALRRLRDGGPHHIVYFYCHGGVAGGVPYIQVGPLTERGITRDLLRSKRIFWEPTQPLVFVNGCHTTALEPESALDLVSGFVETANAAGVIGTEITVFEPLACAFAEACVREFLAGVPIGEAVRRARLTLLADCNPLGLVYIPFVLATLTLRPEAPGAQAGASLPPAFPPPG